MGIGQTQQWRHGIMGMGQTKMEAWNHGYGTNSWNHGYGTNSTMKAWNHGYGTHHNGGMESI